MTRWEFIEELKKCDAEWFIDIGRIRTKLTIGSLKLNACPISALGNEQTSQYHRVGRALGLSSQTIAIIINAADNAHAHSAPLRLKMLEACGLE